MLTDYHLHLRPDEAGTTFERYFTAENVERYREAATAAGIEELGVSEHVYRFRQALDLWRHPLWLENAKDDLDAYCEFVRVDLAASWGSSATSSPAPRSAPRSCWRRATSTTSSARSTSSARATRRSTTTASTSGRAAATPRRSGRRYFEALRPTAPAPASSTSSPTRTWSRSGAGPGRCRRATCAASTSPRWKRSSRAGSAVELSTAGLRKPVGELYPARAFAELCVEAGVPFALSSDAHLPEQVGFGYDRARRLPRLARGRGDRRLRGAPARGSSRSASRVG